MDTKNDKKPNISNFQIFYAFFVKLLPNFVDWNVEKGPLGRSLLSSRLFRRVTCGFKDGLYLKMTPK